MKEKNDFGKFDIHDRQTRYPNINVSCPTYALLTKSHCNISRYLHLPSSFTGLIVFQFGRSILSLETIYPSFISTMVHFWIPNCIPISSLNIFAVWLLVGALIGFLVIISPNLISFSTMPMPPSMVRLISSISRLVNRSLGYRYFDQTLIIVSLSINTVFCKSFTIISALIWYPIAPNNNIFLFLYPNILKLMGYFFSSNKRMGRLFQIWIIRRALNNKLQTWTHGLRILDNIWFKKKRKLLNDCCCSIEFFYGFVVWFQLPTPKS